MITDPNYSTRTLLSAFEAGPIAYTFLRDTFFRGRDYPPTSNIEFDFRRGRRKMAPFVAPLIGGKVMERQGFETRFFKAPRIAPVRALRTPDLEARLPGETIYSSRTEADRAAELLADDSEFLDNAITRREEWMCREVLVNGKITVTAENGYTYVISFLDYGFGAGAGTASNHETVAIKWDQASSDPLADLERARLNMIKFSGISPNVALFGANAQAVFIRNTSVQTLLDNRRIEMATIQPVIQSDAVVRFAMVPGMECYSYHEYFEDDAGTLFPMIPPDFVMLLSTNVQNKIVYGAFTQLEDAKNKRFVTYQTSRIPFVYGDEEGGALYYRLTSCPLPMPVDILGIRIVEALPGGSGPGPFMVGGEEPKPFFESEHESFAKAQEEKGKVIEEREAFEKEAAEKSTREGRGENGDEESRELESHTVDELREIADRESVDLIGADRKADIIKAIKKDRKNR
jgi:hypothetical protein